MAAAGRQGAKALRSRAPARVADVDKKNSAAIAFFMVDSPILMRIFRAAVASSIGDSSGNRKIAN